uniref:Arylsulfatase (type I) n=1 Tax=Steinernema glaseri TaxID=37863 RepID=A0A1I7YA26_9BILA
MLIDWPKNGTEMSTNDPLMRNGFQDPTEGDDATYKEDLTRFWTIWLVGKVIFGNDLKSPLRRTLRP